MNTIITENISTVVDNNVTMNMTDLRKLIDDAVQKAAQYTVSCAHESRTIHHVPWNQRMDLHDVSMVPDGVVFDRLAGV